MPLGENLRFDPEQFGQVRFRAHIRGARYSSIDREESLLELPGLPQALRQCADEGRELDVVTFSVQDLQRAP